MTEMLFRDDPYLRSSEGTVTHISDDGGVVFDKTIFYPNRVRQATVEKLLSRMEINV
jgi:Ser-tRNA(Ala) deacylase AlaX